MTAVQLRDGAAGGVYDSPPGVCLPKRCGICGTCGTLGEKSGFAAAPALFPDRFRKNSCVIELVQDVPWDIKGGTLPAPSSGASSCMDAAVSAGH